MPQFETSQKTVPRRALMFAAEFTPADETAPQRDSNGTLQIPFTMTARTGGVATHPWWGRCIHDFAGMKPPTKPAVTVDYCHCPDDIIGFSTTQEVADNALLMSGSLVSIAPMDRAEEVYLKRKAGVPYEASILTNWEGLVIENISEGMVATVNDQQVEGPLTIFREWELWGVAVCPYGSDSNTDIQFAAGVPGEVQIAVIEGKTMTTPAPAAPVTTHMAKTGKDYMTKFGATKGSLWFAEGKPWEDCLAQFEADMADESKAKDDQITELKAQLSALQQKCDAMAKENETVKGENAAFKRGSPPVSTATAPDTTATPAAPSKFAYVTPGVAKFAEGIKLPTKATSN